MMLNTLTGTQERHAGTAAERVELHGWWTAEIYREWNFPEELIRWWQAASDRLGDTGLFQSPGWVEQCSRAWGTPLLVVALREGDCIRGVIPCHLSTTDFGDSGICSLAADLTYYDIVAEDRAAVLDAFARLIEIRFPGTSLQFDRISGESADLIRRVFEARGCRTWSHAQPHSAYVPVAGNVEEYRASLSSNLRWDLRRKRRRAEQDGVLTWDVYREGDDLQSLLTEAFGIETRGWKGRAGTAVTQKTEMERFLRFACEWAARENKLWFLVLRHNGKMIAFQINFVNGGTMFLYELSFDEDYGRYSPGQLTVYELLERLFGDPSMHTLSILGPCHAWKMRWAKDSEMYHWVTVYPRTIAGRCRYLWRHGWKEPLRKSAAIRRIAARFQKPGSTE